jgi:hypothetical protein
MRGEVPPEEWEKNKTFVEPSWPMTIAIAVIVITFAFGSLWIVKTFWWG